MTIRVRLDAKTFGRFAFYDTFRRNKRWKLPLFFCLILLAFAAVCLFLTDKNGHVTVGVILAVLAVGLPLCWLGSFYFSVRAGAKAQKLPKAVYSLSFSEECVDIQSLTKQEEHVRLPWDRIGEIVFDRGCTYLYATKTKAFLLPDGQADVPDAELRSYLLAHINRREQRTGGKKTEERKDQT